MPTAHIDRFFAPKNTSNLIRLGDDFDGGYVVDKSSVEAASTLIALGVGDSWAFEKAVRSINKIPVEAFDATVNWGHFVTEFAKSLVVFFNWKFVRRRWTILRDYTRFFRGDVRHHQVLVGLDQPPEYMALEGILAAYVAKPGAKAFLKIDIEGWEYRMLDTLVKYSSSISGMAIEFHDFDLHQDRIKDFVTQFGLTICHIHCNNCAPLADDGQPLVVEISFTERPADAADAPVLPNALDMPNQRREADYAIVFT